MIMIMIMTNKQMLTQWEMDMLSSEVWKFVLDIQPAEVHQTTE